jgi:hypothetical protein
MSAYFLDIAMNTSSQKKGESQMAAYRIKLMQDRGYEYSFSDIRLSIGDDYYSASEPLRVVGREEALSLARLLNHRVAPMRFIGLR